MYAILFSRNAKKQLKKLEPQAQERILLALERIRIRPQSYVQKMVGETAYRLRVGDYRVIMDIFADKLIVHVIKIGHRKSVYK